MCHISDKILNRLLPSFISVCKPNGVLQPLKITLPLISLDTFLIISLDTSLHRTRPQPSHLLYNYFFQHPLELYLKHFIKENAMQNMKNAGIEDTIWNVFFFQVKRIPPF